MPKKPLEDLAQFQAWLISEKQISPRTANVYASQVRKTLRLADKTEITADFLDKCFEGKLQEKRLSKAQSYLLRTSWKHFAAFMMDTSNIAIATPSSANEAERFAVPDFIWPIVHELKETNRISLGDLFGFYTCDMCVARGGTYELKSKKRAGVYHILRVNNLDKWIAWATKDGQNPNAPLFPTPDGAERMPVRLLHRMYRTYKNSCH